MIKRTGENPSAVRSKTALKEALLELLKEKSFEEVAIWDITKKAGLSRQTFYTNFSRKEDILDYSLLQLFHKFAELSSKLDPVPYDIVSNYFIYWGRYKELLQVLFEKNLGHLFLDRNRELFSKDLAVISENAANNPAQVEYIKAYLGALSYELLRVWISNGANISISELTTTMDDLMSGKLFSSR